MASGVHEITGAGQVRREGAGAEEDEEDSEREGWIPGPVPRYWTGYTQEFHSQRNKHDSHAVRTEEGDRMGPQR